MNARSINKQQDEVLVLWEVAPNDWITEAQHSETTTLSQNIGHHLSSDAALHPTRTETTTPL
jgi:hypothetical protein